MTQAQAIANCDSHHFTARKEDGRWVARCACGEGWKGDPRESEHAVYKSKCHALIGKGGKHPSIFGSDCKWCEHYEPFCLECSPASWHHHPKGMKLVICRNVHHEDTHEARLTANERMIKDRIQNDKKER